MPGGPGGWRPALDSAETLGRLYHSWALGRNGLICASAPAEFLEDRLLSLMDPVDRALGRSSCRTLKSLVEALSSAGVGDGILC